MDARRTRLLGLLTGAAVTAVVVALWVVGAFEWLELRTYDLRYALVPAETVDTPILLVRIDEETEAALGLRANDITRTMYAEAVRHLSRAGAALIAFDATFDRPRDPEGDAALAAALSEARNVVLARYIGEKDHRIPLATFREVELSEALINVALDSDGVLRNVPLLGFDYTGDQPEPVLALALEVARLYRAGDVEEELDLEDPDTLGLGALRIPYPDGRMRIHFYGPPATFPRLPFWKAAIQELPPEQIRGKIVLIGSSAPSMHDYYQTPYTEKLVMALTGEFERARGLRMDGFEIHANALQTILDQRFIVRSRDLAWLVPAMLMAVGAIGLFLMLHPRGSSLPIFGIWALLLAGALAAAYFLFWRWRYWLDVVPLVTLIVLQFSAAVGYHRAIETRKRRDVEAMFGRYVSRRITEFLVDNPELANPGGRKETLTILFSDIRGFTALSEKLEAAEVQRLLSEYFTEMTRILFAHGGTLDKFMGDALMAFFGNPEPQPDHARRAVRTALAMQAAVGRLNERWAAEGRVTIAVGIGINTGEVTVGNLGSTEFLDYTVVGDAVNVACRLEQHAAGGEIIISESTYAALRAEVEITPREPIRVKGKRELVAVYDLRAWRDPDAMPEFIG
ncbi:MAG TPA: adenylate/guanylate cyclase domain-containing protein [Nitrospirales bacterium]|nr:adenylate/guanylate cyclase domain-containing protein [Nitrospirales bacterium]